MCHTYTVLVCYAFNVLYYIYCNKTCQKRINKDLDTQNTSFKSKVCQFKIAKIFLHLHKTWSTSKQRIKKIQQQQQQQNVILKNLIFFFTLKNLGLEVHTVIRYLSECILLFCHIFLVDYNCIYNDSHVHKTQTNSYFGTFCPMIRCRLYRIQKRNIV